MKATRTTELAGRQRTRPQSVTDTAPLFPDSVEYPYFKDGQIIATQPPLPASLDEQDNP